MKSTSQLTDFYYKVLYPTLQKLETDRKQLRYRIILIGSLYTLFLAFVAYLLRYEIGQNLDFGFFIGFIYFGGGAFIYKVVIKDYTKEFKEKIISPLIKAISTELNFSPETHIPSRYIEESDLFHGVDRVSGNDYVYGEIDSVKIEFSDIHVEEMHKDSDGKEDWSTIFRGLFIVSEFNKNFQAKTIILPDTAQKSFGNLVGNWLQSKNFNRDELVKMDSSAFEKEFVVYSNDQIEARYILSHSLMDKILLFKQKSKHPVYISFIRNNIHIGVSYNKDLFEPSIFHSLLEYKIAMEYIKTLHLAIGIIEELKLNQKLWSKR